MITGIKIVLVILLLIAVPKAAAQGVVDEASTPYSATDQLPEASTETDNGNSVPEGNPTTDGERPASPEPVASQPEPIKETPTELNPIPQLVFCRSHGNNKGINIENAVLGQEMAQTMGWSGSEWEALLELWSCESQWVNTAQNPTSTAFGIAQFLDSTWGLPRVGCQKTADATEQIRCGLIYIREVYGSPSVAMRFHLNNNWY
jgi:hypothetical protein